MGLNLKTLGAALVVALALAILAVALSGDRRGEAPDATGLVGGSIVVDFSALDPSRPPIAQRFNIEVGSSAWDAIDQALGEDRVTYQDFGGDLGIFITSFDGATVTGNRFWRFSVNGVSSEVGVSGYKVRDGDILEFKVETF